MYILLQTQENKNFLLKGSAPWLWGTVNSLLTFLFKADILKSQFYLYHDYVSPCINITLTCVWMRLPESYCLTTPSASLCYLLNIMLSSLLASSHLYTPPKIITHSSITKLPWLPRQNSTSKWLGANAFLSPSSYYCSMPIPSLPIPTHAYNRQSGNCPWRIFCFATQIEKGYDF